MNDEIKTIELNALTYHDIYKQLSLLAKNIFEWINLPDTVNERFLERILFEEGKIVFFKDDKFGYVITKCNNKTALNFYEEPTKVTTVAVGENYINKTLDADQCVIIRNNCDEIPTRYAVRLYTQRITDAQRTIDVNINQQKTPLIILCDDTQRLTLINLFKKYNGNEPFIFADKSLRDTLDKIKTVDTKAPYLADKLMKYKHDIWNEFYTYIGINNVNSDKRERLITDEVNANNEQIEYSALIMLNERKRACKLINKMFGLNIDVKIRDIKMFNKTENDDIMNIEGDSDE